MVNRREITQYTSAIPPAFKDETGKGFFAPLVPKFKTNRGKTGGRLGIHPDGNVYGTAGCIGLRENAKEFYDLMSRLPASAKITLEVTD